MLQNFSFGHISSHCVKSQGLAIFELACKISKTWRSSDRCKDVSNSKGRFAFRNSKQEFFYPKKGIIGACEASRNGGDLGRARRRFAIFKTRLISRK
ncbi:hypothetical protein TNIN_26441 [Trichonephila inaurata madagascariensis]|uniref:Uncharacterized protein n=1 Tax=Trichonephila inaurata madagascariensis TaxID=2747483 RepID=A0A8X6JI71_9ARAC|nr:hypothetical protein TNIN_26441 [Trichonephila inaurata madagascariensis]